MPILIDNLADDREAFALKYDKSLENIQILHATAVDFLNRPYDISEPIDKLIYFLSVACLREFNEILLLSSNRYGIGALKILRPMYERVVTLTYLHRHPDLIRRFIDYSQVHWHKMLKEARVAAGHDDVMPKEQMVEIEERYQALKETYEQTACKKCKAKEIRNWVKIGTPEMASEVGGEIRRLYFNAFLWPTFNIHTTFYALSRQLKATEDGKLAWDVMAEDDAVHLALNIAHALLIQVIDVLDVHFKLSEGELVKQRAVQWSESWSEGKPRGEST